MKWIFYSLILAAAGVFLAWEKSNAAALRSELSRQRLAHEELEMQRRERTRLLALQPTAAELAQLRRAAAERTEHERAIDDAEGQHREAQAPGLQVGEWFPSHQWQDRGHQTPVATLQTMLWAAAGGDIARLQSLFHLDDGTRAKLADVYAALPAHARAMYAGPEQLIAAFTAKAIPDGDAQLVWEQQSGPDEAVACIWVNPSSTSSPAGDPGGPRPDANKPPMLTANSKRSQALLSLRRFDDGWRIIVPAHAIDKLAKELGIGK